MHEQLCPISRPLSDGLWIDGTDAHTRILKIAAFFNFLKNQNGFRILAEGVGELDDGEQTAWEVPPGLHQALRHALFVPGQSSSHHGGG